MEHDEINDIYDRISRILKNDQQFPPSKVGRDIANVATSVTNIEYYYDSYPQLLDIVELGAGLDFQGNTHQTEIIQQIRYKLSELRSKLPEAGRS